MSKRNKYIVYCSDRIKGPDNEYYFAVWGKVTKVASGIKVGFKNDYIIVNPDYIVSQALCNATPTALEPTEFEYEDDSLDFVVHDVYICVEDRIANGKIVDKFNKTKVQKRKNG